MKPRIAPKTKTTLPDIKKVFPMMMQKPSPKLSSSRLSRQSCSIETTVSIQSEPQRKQSQNKKSDQIVKNKSYYNHRALMNDYLKRTNMTIQTKVFTFNSQDDYIKRCLQSHGWVENHLSSALYDLKWVYTDNADDFVTQLDGQFYNHFKGTKELTTKQCLLVNFKNQSEYGFDTSDFFPRAFDLGNASDREDFLKEYERTCVEIILKRVVKYLKQRRKQYCKNIKQEIMINYEKKKQEKLIKKMELKKTIRRKFKTIYTAEQLQSENNDKDLRFDLQIISEVLSRLSDYKRQIEYGYYDDKNFELSTQYIIKTRQNYSQLQKFDQGHTPSQFMINKLFKYHFFFKKHDSGYKSDGVRNIWIVKPGGCARGQGIYLETDISEAINSGMQMQARLIQKYIERPLLYKKQKFDLRQWVLVRSFQPLKVYVFSHCYMRMCSQTYDLNDTKNLLRHLTNFSLNKQNFINQTQSIYSSDHLEEWLKSLNVDWQNTLRPQINEIIIKTLRIVQDQFEGESKYCFELFGFDIMLDEYYKPWLLEVNLSPACAERVDWLSTMLDQMAESMFNIIFGDEFRLPAQYKYELIFDEEEFQQEIVGQKCNIRREKLIDKRYIEYMATLMIQKFYRMYLGKKQLKFLRNTKYAIVIQKYGRRYLATKQRYYLKRTYCAQRIQNTVRMFLAVKQKQHLKRQLNATKIQCLFRRKQAIKMKYYLKQEYCALLIQSLIYMKKAKQKSNQLKIHLLKYKLIQKNWRIIYKKKCNSSIRIQKIIRGKLQRKRFKILKQQNKSSIVIQKHYRGYKCRQLREYLKREYSSLILQCLMRMKISRRKLKLNKITDGLSKIDKVYETFNGRRRDLQGQGYQENIVLQDGYKMQEIFKETQEIEEIDQFIGICQDAYLEEKIQEDDKKKKSNQEDYFGNAFILVQENNNEKNTIEEEEITGMYIDPEDKKIWADDLKDYQQQRKQKGEFQKTKIVTQKEMKLKQSEFNPVLQVYQNVEKDKNKRENDFNRTQQQASKKFEMVKKYLHEYDLVNLDPIQGIERLDEREQLKQCLLPPNFNDYNIITNEKKHEDYYKNMKVMTTKKVYNRPVVNRNKRDYNILNNKYIDDHDNKIQHDIELNNEQLKELSSKVRNFDLIQGQYYDAQRQEEYQKKLKEDQQNHGKTFNDRFPPSWKFRESVYLDQTKEVPEEIKLIDEINKNHKKRFEIRHVLEHEYKERDIQDQLRAEDRLLKRHKYDDQIKKYDKEFDILTLSKPQIDHILKALPPKPPQNSWDKVQMTKLQENIPLHEISIPDGIEFKGNENNLQRLPSVQKEIQKQKSKSEKSHISQSVKSNSEIKSGGFYLGQQQQY